MLEIVTSLIVTAIVIIAVVYVLSIWVYKRAAANMAFIRTGFLGTRVCIGRGAIVLPVFHEITWVSLETIKLIVSRARDQAVLTSDKIRIDVIAELYAHVGRSEDDVLTASRSLGDKTFDSDRVRNLLEAKVVSVLRSYAATKTLSELHENRVEFARAIKESVIESFQANGLTLEEVTIVTLEQAGKEYFKTDNVFDAEGLKIITEITSDARRKVHETEKRTTVAIRQKDLDTQLELLDIEKDEAFARAGQDKAVANEQALRLGEKQIYVLDQRMAVEEKEIENEKQLERLRTDRQVAVIQEAQKREAEEIRKERALEQERRDREIAIIAKARQEELADIERKLALEKAERDREIELIAKAREHELADIDRELARQSAEKERDIELSEKERARQQADIQRATAVTAEEEEARNKRHASSETASLAMRRRTLETRLAMLEIDRDEAFAAARQEQEVANEKARVLSEQQKYILAQRWEVQQEEINREEELEKARITRDAAVIEQAKLREAAEVRRTLAREQEERDREIALVAKDEELRRAEVRQARTVELEERDREIAIIGKEREREIADIQRFLAREQEERDREITLAAKTRELEEAEADRLAATEDRRRAEHAADSVAFIADAERARKIERIAAEKHAETQRIEEKMKAEISRMHVVQQAGARQEASEHEAEATLARARATSEAQKINAEGVEREVAAPGRAEMAIEQLRVINVRQRLEAEAAGLESKAEALKKYNEAATFLELAKMHIEAERDIHIDQAKAMGSALSGAQIRMYGGGNGDGTVDTIRGLFTQGFGLGEVLEGVAQSLPEGLRQRFAANGVRGLFGRPYDSGSLMQVYEQLNALVSASMSTDEDRSIPFSDALQRLADAAGADQEAGRAVALLDKMNEQDVFSEVSFDKVWALLQAAARSAG